MKTFSVSAAPHVPARRSVRSLMAWVLIALLPGIAAQTWFFGPGVLIQIVIAVLVAMAAEALMLRIRGLPLASYLGDLSAPLAGVLLAICLPPLAPWWIAATGALAALILAKHLYGGLGHNLFNPAMVGFAVVLICFPLALSRWPEPGDELALTQVLGSIFLGSAPSPGWDVIAQATPLDATRLGQASALSLNEIRSSSVFSSIAGRGWEWITLGYLAGGLLLLWQRIIPWQVPAGVIGAVLLITLPLHAYDPDLHPSALQELLSGALMLAAFFIATDPVSGCTTPRGRLIFGAGVAILTLIIRRWGAYPDGVAFAVLLMNCAAPWIDLHTRPRAFGERSSPP